MQDLADRITAHLLERWLIGTETNFMDDPPYLEEAKKEEVASVIREVIERESK